MTRKRKAPKVRNLMRAHPSFIALCEQYAADWKARTGFDMSQTKVTEVLYRHLTEHPPAWDVGAVIAPEGAQPASEEITP